MEDGSEKHKIQKTVIIGAGPVGSLAALYAANRGHDVEVYELRGDLRNPSVTPLNFTKSINLALSERGINALKHSKNNELLANILNETLPMKARMIHSRSKSGLLREESQDYDIHGRAIFAIDRSTLNSQLLQELEALPNVKLFFNHKLVGVNFKSNEVKLETTPNSITDDFQGNKFQEVVVNFDLLIGADGAHSAVRQQMMKNMCMEYSQSYIDTLWCEFTIKARESPSNNQSPQSKFRMSPEHLHIWPGKEYMFIAIPSHSGDFVCTLFAPSSIYKYLAQSHEVLLEFFHQKFPGVTPELIPPASLIESFTQNPHLPLISVNCSPHHYGDSTVILGDATHAMVPFFGQGMNAGLEDVRILFETLDRYAKSSNHSPDSRQLALEQYSALRTEDSKAISQLALENYLVMRNSVTSYKYKSRKWLEEKLNLWFPSLGWATKYSRVSFGNDRYSEVISKSKRQEAIINRILITVESMALIGTICWIFKVKKVLANLS
ncbi:Kynurenine 3-monooxygenase [Erysiphe neolycopersici]|uniref:Kynurenine 3-monooxygenase n=1 Tax=Erysiphe neolycopersici TaxID=212602 RepID=A0A420HXX3_9PEZI|nr:Kynurenine 3-monooxygenase [Erysiphe neolycopersici]